MIDADMRKGYLHSLLGIDGGNGLSDVLAQQVSIENAIKKTNVEGMDIIVRGQVPPNPSELLMTRGLGELIDWASQNYDMVLVDTPPILAVTDAAIIGHHAGTALMIARFGVNTVKEVEVSIRRFEQNGTNIKGVILNAVEKAVVIMVVMVTTIMNTSQRRSKLRCIDSSPFWAAVNSNDVCFFLGWSS